MWSTPSPDSASTTALTTAGVAVACQSDGLSANNFYGSQVMLLIGGALLQARCLH